MKVSYLTAVLACMFFLSLSQSLCAKTLRAGDSREPVVKTPDVNVYQNPTLPGQYYYLKTGETETDISEFRYGFLIIKSKPGGAEVRLNGAYIGKTPISGIKLREGTYDIEITLFGHVPWRDVVRVIGESEVQISPEMKKI